ncbi:calcium-binding protein, partial [Rhizobiaceae sp. 2RAB30]
GPTGVLAASAFRAGTNALDADDRFIYNAATRSLYYDQDGSGATVKVLVAVFDKPFALAAGDIVLF